MNTLSIHTERATIEITQRPARMTVESRSPAFSVQSDMPRMEIQTVKPTFDVDWSAVHASSGMASPMQLNDQFTQESRQKALEGIGSIVERGDTLKNVNDPNAITEVAVSVSVKDTPEFNVGLMPQERARIEWDPGSCTIEWSSPVLQIEWDKEFMPVIQWEPYAVEVQLRNRPSVQIRVNLENVPGLRGARVDQQI